jgi:hypothetical protein
MVSRIARYNQKINATAIFGRRITNTAPEVGAGVRPTKSSSQDFGEGID